MLAALAVLLAIHYGLFQIVSGTSSKVQRVINRYAEFASMQQGLFVRTQHILPAGWCRQLFLFLKRWLQSVPYQYHSKAYHNYHNVPQSSETLRLSFISAVASRQNFLSIRPTAVPSQLSHTKGTTTTAPRRIASTEPGRCADSQLHEGLNTSVAQAAVLASRTWRKPPNRDKVDGRCGRLSTRGNSIWQR